MSEIGAVDFKVIQRAGLAHGGVSIEQQIACVRREIGMRERVYPKWIDTKRMSREQATREIAGMKAVLATLEALERGTR